jgi:hypothetical protein
LSENEPDSVFYPQEEPGLVDQDFEDRFAWMRLKDAGTQTSVHCVDLKDYKKGFLNI